MARKNRKIGFYYISLENDTLNLFDSYNEVLSHIDGLNSIDKRRNIAGNKFGYLNTINSFSNNERHQLVFKSATNKFRPPLLDRNTITERDSPKTIDEGETHKTHLISKMINGDLIIILEKHKDGLNINQVINYLNSFSLSLPTPIKFIAEMIIKDGFLEEVNAMERVISAEIQVDKQLLGSNTLNYSERINSVKHEIMISVKAKNRDNIADFSRDVFALLSGGSQDIKKIKLTGKNSDNNLVVINTDRIERQEYVNPEIDDDTGEIITEQLLEQMEIIIYNF